MENGPTRAAFWADFILKRCEYPAPDLLREHLAHATFAEFCRCECNSFGVRNGGETRSLVPPRDEVLPGRHAAIFEADIRLADSKTIEIIIFANDEGNLDYIEVDCCANSEAVPDEVIAPDRPFHVRASNSLNMDA
ncbi:hypothetical protein [Sphingomonas sp.]|uniref:hypothetical protein n=1 Tax=Sphingomonas sp. TaxID=28214 RepID=UPI003CC5062D